MRLSGAARTRIEGVMVLAWLLAIPGIAIGGWWLTAWAFWTLGEAPDDHPALLGLLVWLWLLPAYGWGRYGLRWIDNLMRRWQ